MWRIFQGRMQLKPWQVSAVYLLMTQAPIVIATLHLYTHKGWTRSGSHIYRRDYCTVTAFLSLELLQPEELCHHGLEGAFHRDPVAFESPRVREC